MLPFSESLSLLYSLTFSMCECSENGICRIQSCHKKFFVIVRAESCADCSSKGTQKMKREA